MRGGDGEVLSNFYFHWQIGKISAIRVGVGKPWILEIDARRKDDDVKVALFQPSTTIRFIHDSYDKCGDINKKAWKTYRNSLDHIDQRRDENWFRGQDRTGDTLKMVVC